MCVLVLVMGQWGGRRREVHDDDAPPPPPFTNIIRVGCGILRTSMGLTSSRALICLVTAPASFPMRAASASMSLGCVCVCVWHRDGGLIYMISRG